MKFKTYFEGEIKELEISEGGTVTLESGGETEEGYNHDEETFRLRNGVLTCHHLNEGRDCDGYISREQTYVANGTTQQDGVEIIYWEPIKGSGSIYDANAVAAGY